MYNTQFALTIIKHSYVKDNFDFYTSDTANQVAYICSMS